MTPLNLACNCNACDIVMLLIEKGVDINATNNVLSISCEIYDVYSDIFQKAAIK